MNMYRTKKRKTKESLFHIRKMLKLSFLLFTICSFFLFTNKIAHATGTYDQDSIEEERDLDVNGSIGPIDFQINRGGEEGGVSSTLQIMLFITLISLAPSILIMVTSFTRILVVLHFTRAAIGTNSTPPNQVLIGIAIFLTVFIMSPTFSQINERAIKPLSNNEITEEEAFHLGLAPLREFMLEQTKPKDLQLFLDIANTGEVETVDEIPTTVIIPAFIISELKVAFLIGFLIYIPFLIIDMVVASTLMSMGMMMLPPTTISMPFKILLFIMADGWNLIIGELVKTFY